MIELDRVWAQIRRLHAELYGDVESSRCTSSDSPTVVDSAAA